ncbi:MAG TPA: TolC family protein, partial [Methylophilus sp.]|nr:TolC family protein [Methylophilus sp.]
MMRWQVLAILGFSWPWMAAQAEEIADIRVRQRLEKTEGRALETYSRQPGVPLHDAIKQQQNRKPAVTVDLKSALKPFDSPESD